MRTMKIAIQGALGSFHHLAAQKWFGSDAVIVPCDTFPDVFTSLESAQADAAIVAIENSLYGSITAVYDLLVKHHYPIIGELPEHIHQQLIGYPGTKLEDITAVYSMAPALAQCHDFLTTHLPHATRIEREDTAESVSYIKSLESSSSAAIASHAAATLHGMSILQENIEDESANFTRFLVIQPNAPAVEHADKASLVLRTDHSPGALYRALGIFAGLGINLTKLQSRPIRGQVWKYQFFIDIEADQRQLDIALSELNNLGCEINVLGHYKAAQEIEVD